MFSRIIDQIATRRREENTIIAEPGEQLEWLCLQLAKWPVRVDETKTINTEFLMLSAARTIAAQSEQIANLQANASN